MSQDSRDVRISWKAPNPDSTLYMTMQEALVRGKALDLIRDSRNLAHSKVSRNRCLSEVRALEASSGLSGLRSWAEKRLGLK